MTNTMPWLDLGLELPIGGGRTVVISQPSVEECKKILALSFRVEQALTEGQEQRHLPRAIERLLVAVAEGDEHPALGEQYEALAAALPPAGLARAEVYAILYWARGKVYADTVAELLWVSERAAVDA